MIPSVAKTRLGVLGILLAAASTVPAENAFNLGGTVVDQQSHSPVASARVILEIWSQSPPLRTFTNSSGLFSFTITVKDRPLLGRLLVYDTDHFQFEGSVEISAASKPQDIVLKPLFIATTKIDRKQKIGTMPGFPGENWSNWMDVCSDSLDRFERIGSSVDFTLEGDRKCGAWAECREVRHDPTSVCWQFRVQGHSEWFQQLPFGSVRIAMPHAALNIGRLSYDVVRSVEALPSQSGIPDIWLQFAGAENNAIIQRLADALRLNGLHVAAIERIDKKYPSKVEFFHETDGNLAARVLTITSRVLAAQKILGVPVLEFVTGLENKARANQVEVWVH